MRPGTRAYHALSVIGGSARWETRAFRAVLLEMRIPSDEMREFRAFRPALAARAFRRAGVGWVASVVGGVGAVWARPLLEAGRAPAPLFRGAQLSRRQIDEARAARCSASARGIDSTNENASVCSGGDPPSAARCPRSAAPSPKRGTAPKRGAGSRNPARLPERGVAQSAAPPSAGTRSPAPAPERQRPRSVPLCGMIATACGADEPARDRIRRRLPRLSPQRCPHVDPCFPARGQRKAPGQYDLPCVSPQPRIPQPVPLCLRAGRRADCARCRPGDGRRRAARISPARYRVAGTDRHGSRCLQRRSLARLRVARVGTPLASRPRQALRMGRSECGGRWSRGFAGQAPTSARPSARAPAAAPDIIGVPSHPRLSCERGNSNAP